MNIVNLDSLIAQGKLLPASQLDVEGKYVIVAVANEQARGEKYPLFAAKLEDVIVDSRPYKVYTALVTQSGTSNPVLTVKENTIGTNMTFTRGSAGLYYLNGNIPLNSWVSWTTVGPFEGLTEFAYITRNEEGGLQFLVPSGDDYLNGCLEIRIYN
jgi:hypothetical protein